MNKNILIALTLIFSVTIGYAYWQSRPEEETETEVETSVISGLTCHQNDRYFIVVRTRNIDVGEDILVKTKSNANDNIACSYDVASDDREFTDAEPNFFLGLQGDNLLIDQGTAPPPRRVIIVDLRTGEEVYDDMYNRPVTVEDESFTYWKPTDENPTDENCAELESWEANGLGAGIEEHVTLDLQTLTLDESGETRCSARQ